LLFYSSYSIWDNFFFNTYFLTSLKSSNLNTKMTALADEIRELSGTTTAKGVDEMTTDIDAANTEIAEQTDLLAQIATALEGKASGSGGVTLPELDNPASAADILSGKEAIDGTGNKITGTIATKTSSNLTASGATVTVPAGYYASQSTKSVATATQATPSVSIDSNGKITASATQTAGYVSAGTKTGTKQMTTQAAKTVTPSTSSQTAVEKNVYTTGVVTVAAIPSSYIIPSGTKTITANGTYDIKNYASATINVASTGEDITDETNAYTTKLASLETAISALETELEGKASGGSGGDEGTINVCTISMSQYGGVGLNTWFTVIDDTGSITTKNMVMEGMRIGMVECLNIVCGSLFVVEDNWSESVIEGTAECIFASENYSIFKAPTVAGEAGSISV
jgi:hypothetical protein